MFVSVRYGDDDSVILNADCGVQAFKNCLRQKCNITESKCIIDLADEYGTVQYLSSKNPRTRVSNILETRLKYVLIELKREANGTVVESLLKNWVPRSESIGELTPERNIPKGYKGSSRRKVTP